jgi:hypothetical protein
MLELFQRSVIVGNNGKKKPPVKAAFRITNVVI